MTFAAVRRFLIVAHRWLGLILTPVFLVVIVTGLVLSFRPVVNDLASRAADGISVDARALGALMRKLEARGQTGGGSGERAARDGARESGGEGTATGGAQVPGGQSDAAPGNRGLGRPAGGDASAGGAGPAVPAPAVSGAAVAGARGAEPGGRAAGVDGPGAARPSAGATGAASRPGAAGAGPGGPGGPGNMGPVGGIALVQGGRVVEVTGSNPDIAGRWDVASGTRIGPLPDGPDVFRIAQNLHKSLMLGLNVVVEIATYVMLGLMIAGPFLAWIRFRNSLLGWHMVLGWCLLPLTLLSPLTAVLMIHHIGPARPPMPRTERPVSIAQAIDIAGRDHDLSSLAGARRLRGGTVMLLRAGDADNLMVTDKAASVMTGGPNIFKQIHEGTWGGLWSGLLNAVVSLVLLVLTVTGFVSWFARWRRNRTVPLARGADILVAHASQTGTAARFANATAEMLQRGGERVALAPLGSVPPAELKRFRTVLLLVSTTGEGDLPDGARGFLKGLKPGTARGARFAMLGLGDRAYAQFCGGAETLRTALLAAGATEALPLARADRDPAPAWSGWIQNLEAGLGLRGAAPVAPVSAAPVTLTLTERRRLDDPAGGDTQETWFIGLDADADLSFRPGDLLRLLPGEGERERAYSIGSSSRIDPRRIELTVRLHRWQDEAGTDRFGRASGELVRRAPIGSRITARLDPNPAFNPPADPTWPIIMIAAGSGIAPFPGFLSERQASGRAGPAWLFFGNRHRAGDFLWSDRFDAALDAGALTRLDTAFSRDAEDGARVPERLRKAASDVLTWLMEQKAVVYICGSRNMARSVEAALADILAERGGRNPAAAHAEVARWAAEGRIRIDAFD